MTIFNTVILIVVSFFIFVSSKVNYFAPIASTFSKEKTDVCQSDATMYYDVGFAIVYRRIYCDKFCHYPIRCLGIFVSAFEILIILYGVR